MAISLNNHETRIKALEDAGGSGVLTKVYENTSGSKSLTYNLSSYDIVFVKFGSNNGGGTVITAVLCPSLTTSTTYAVHAPSEYHARLTLTSTKQTVSYVGGNDVCRITGIYGLKLYYSFSYNIIYKILLRKISRLCPILHFRNERSVK